MVEKRRKIRMEHLERFRDTGRVVTLTSDLRYVLLSNLYTQIPIADDESR